MCSVATGHVAVGGALGRCAVVDRGLDVIPVVGQPDQRRTPVDINSDIGELAEKEPFVLILREGQHEGVGTETCAHIRQPKAGDVPIAGPEMDRIRDDPAPDDLVTEAELPIELQSPGVQTHRPRLLDGAVLLVDDAHRHTSASQTQCHHKPRRPGADDQNGVHPTNLH